MRRLGAIYDRWLQRAPRVTKGITAAFIFGIGDRIAQQIEQSQVVDENDDQLHDVEADPRHHVDHNASTQEMAAFDNTRTMRMMIWGGGIHAALLLHPWYKFVERTVTSSGRTAVIKKVAMDMFIFAPQSNFLFLTIMQVMEGKRNPEEILSMAASTLPKTLAANYTYWPFVNLAIYGVVPVQYRVLVSNLGSVGWSAILSRINSSKKHGLASDIEVLHEDKARREAVELANELNSTQGNSDPRLSAQTHRASRTNPLTSAIFLATPFVAPPTMRRLGTLYNHWIQTFPLLTKSVTSAVIFGIGDRIAQRIETTNNEATNTPVDKDEDNQSKNDDVDHARTLRMMVWGGAMMTPMLHTWYNFVEKRVAGKSRRAVLTKVLLDMFIYTPPGNFAFFTAIQILEGKTNVREIIDVTMAKLPQTILGSWSFWPFMNIISYGFVPLPYRVLYGNIVSIGWSAYLSQMSAKKHHAWEIERSNKVEVERLVDLEEGGKAEKVVTI